MHKLSVVVVTLLLSSGCQGQRLADDSTVPVAPTAAPSTRTPAAGRPAPASAAAASSKPAWWCLARPNDVPGVCYRDTAECQSYRTQMLQRGVQPNDCAPN